MCTARRTRLPRHLVHDAEDEPIAVEPLGPRDESVPRRISSSASTRRSRPAGRRRSPRWRRSTSGSVRSSPTITRPRRSSCRSTPTETSDPGRLGDGPVRFRDNPPLVDVFSPVLTEVEPTEPALREAQRADNRMPIGRLLHCNDTVWASIPVLAAPQTSRHPPHARVQVMTGADELDDRLHGEFGRQALLGEVTSRRRASPASTAPGCTSRARSRRGRLVAGLGAQQPASDRNSVRIHHQ